jgi:hypothetical protein
VAHDADNKRSLLPFTLAQNPAPSPETGQDFLTKKQQLVDETMQVFFRLLPSNYVSSVNGPWYTLQFQAIAEQIAEIQILAEEIAKDSDWDFTRSEFLFEVLGTLVFPQATEREGFPIIDGDTEYRSFLHQMVLLLLQGSKVGVVEQGVELLGVDVTIVEKFLHSVQRDPNGAWTIDNQFEMEGSIEGFPELDTPLDIFQGNVDLVVQALKPAHTLFEYRFLFRDMFNKTPPTPPNGGAGSGSDGGSGIEAPSASDSFGRVFDDSTGFGSGDDESGYMWELDTYYYDDLRKYCYGAKTITGTGGETLADRTLFTDPTLSFESVREGSVLTIDSGTNTGPHKVIEVKYFLFGDDSTARAYTTSPSGLTGTATVEGDTITDSSQNWALAVENEILTFTAGPNAGSYRLDTLLGSDGGKLGLASGPATEVRVSPSILRVERKMTAAATGQTYSVTVDRLGVKTPKTITGEDVSEQFFL